MRRQRKLLLSILGLPFYFLFLFLVYSPILRNSIQITPLLYPPNGQSLRQIGPSANLAIFSVFLDRRVSDNQTEIRSYHGHVNGVLRIILVKRRSFQPRLHCLFADGTSVPTRDLHGNPFAFYELTENHQRLYGGYSVHCDVPPFSQLMRGVTIWVDGPEYGRTVLPVIHANASKIETLPSQQSPITTPQFDHRFAVCVPAMHHTAKLNAAFLSDWFKVHIRLGVTKFRIYYSELISKDLKDLFWSLKSQAEIDLYPLFWQENNRAVQQDSWYYLQTMTVNDCLLRSLYDTEYAFFGDLDEVLIPHSSTISNWSDLVREVWDNRNVPGICFPAYKFYGPDSSMSASLLRSAKIDRIRSKCLVRPNAIFEMGIHHISKPFEERASMRLKTAPNLTHYAFIHHYHRLSAGKRTQNLKKAVLDTSILRFLGK
ncbi:hypothetical protein ECG_09783 [Echinococcus granulosus]|uniref:Glycosyltransferase family 92 protein n=1 Tax=Echinococcus granulosus TaxID=6210 RepID=U6JMX3_ECHGR|nr:hypothetical protein EGR_08952 [Echinococcus granulosus]EUB56204.1 hypothetical protein EGR_08952 [Echinococcus granulosus]KAH9278060.1 hypothetical protein ECG_09783 [Echinococcus granulosus]CDS24772.1 protein of unknown function DUF23 [Echinococcus granulosus]